MLSAPNRVRPGWARRARTGFSLIEVAIATVIVGVGVTAMVVATRSGTQVNAAGRDVTQAMFLAQEIREWTLKLPFRDPNPANWNNAPGPDGAENPQVSVNDLDDLMSVTYCPPRRCPGQGESLGSQMTDLAGWAQTTTLEWKDPNALTVTVAAGTTNLVRVNVAVTRNNKPVLASAWLVARRATE